MIECTCLVQEGQITAQTQLNLRESLEQFTRSAFKEGPKINWIEVGKGSGFTAAKPSTSSLVLVRSSEALEHSRRETLLNDLCDRWQAATGCSPDEIVGVLSDPTPA